MGGPEERGREGHGRGWLGSFSSFCSGVFRKTGTSALWEAWQDGQSSDGRAKGPGHYKASTCP